MNHLINIEIFFKNIFSLQDFSEAVMKSRVYYIYTIPCDNLKVALMNSCKLEIVKTFTKNRCDVV